MGASLSLESRRSRSVGEQVRTGEIELFFEVVYYNVFGIGPCSLFSELRALLFIPPYSLPGVLHRDFFICNPNTRDCRLPSTWGGGKVLSFFPGIGYFFSFRKAGKVSPGDEVVMVSDAQEQASTPITGNGRLPAVEVTALSVRREQTILQDITWRVERGQHWVVLGPNGSGKTTLLSTLTAYFPPSSGTVRVAGKEYGRYDWRELRKRIGVVSSALKRKVNRPVTALDMVLSGKEARINHPGDINTADRDRAEHILADLECLQLRDRPWTYLSQGERQRVMIGRALMSGLEVLILDEPCAGLDPVARERFLQFVDDLARRADAPTIIYVTHHVEEIMPAFTHVLILKEGQVAASGPKQDVLTSTVLRQAFGIPLDLKAAGSRYALQVRLPSKTS